MIAQEFANSTNHTARNGCAAASTGDGMMNSYRGYIYTIQWMEGAANYTVYFNNVILRGVGNHGTAKNIIDTCLAYPERCHI